MLRLFGAILLLMTTVSCYSQVPQSSSPLGNSNEAKPPATKLEAFSGKHGRLVIKDTYELVAKPKARIGNIQIEALSMYEPGSTTKTKGLRVEVTEGGRLERSNISFIDLDELPSLSQAVTYMADLATKWGTTNRGVYSEVIYTSKGEFQVGFFQKAGQAGAFVSSGTIGQVTAFLDLSELPNLKSAIDQANELLASK